MFSWQTTSNDQSLSMYFAQPRLRWGQLIICPNVIDSFLFWQIQYMYSFSPINITIECVPDPSANTVSICCFRQTSTIFQRKGGLFIAHRIVLLLSMSGCRIDCHAEVFSRAYIFVSHLGHVAHTGCFLSPGQR